MDLINSIIIKNNIDRILIIASDDLYKRKYDIYFPNAKIIYQYNEYSIKNLLTSIGQNSIHIILDNIKEKYKKKYT